MGLSKFPHQGRKREGKALGKTLGKARKIQEFYLGRGAGHPGAPPRPSWDCWGDFFDFLDQRPQGHSVDDPGIFSVPPSSPEG